MSVVDNKFCIGDQVVVCGHSLQVDGLRGFVTDFEWTESCSEWMYLLDTSAHWFDERKLIKPTEEEADRLMHACQRAEDEGKWVLHKCLAAAWTTVEVILVEMEEGI